ncbi:MAG: UPF0182 family protein [Longimicrobiales bacterium]|nr:UPF0182 family protein [Longimicrobiales bacterium]
MRRRVGRIALISVIAVLLLLVLGRGAVGFYTDVLWYDGLGFLSTFWKRFALGLSVRAVAAVVAAAFVFVNLWWVARHLGPVRVRRRYGNIEIAEQVPRKYVLAIIVGVAVLGGWWLAELQLDDGAVLAVASWMDKVAWGVADPLFGRDVAFYLFTLPVATTVLEFITLITVWSLALVGLGHVLVGGIEWDENRVSMTPVARKHLGVLVAVMVLLLGVRFWLGRYLLVVDGNGVAGALGYTDVEARLPAAWAMAFLSVVAAGALVYGAWRRALLPPILGLGGLLAAGLLLGQAYPALVQKFRVEPNELSREAPYIRWNLEFTRRAYGLETMARASFPYRSGARPDLDRLGDQLAHMPLWDTEPLERAYNEIQTLFPYYWFPDVDYDRYGPAGAETQVALGVREFRPGGLEEGNRTWQSLRLNPSYIRGMGVVASPAHPVRPGDGTPELWIRNVNPVVTDTEAAPALELARPSVFFGETMDDYVIIIPGRDSAFTGEPGRDFPRGVPLSSFARELAFAWRFGDETLLFSGEVTRESRVVFRRTLQERVEELAPFILWDPDPMPAIVDGGVVWLVDGYTTSSSFPLSRSVPLGRASVRYLRPSVKASVDAITGETHLYAVQDDPLLETYAQVFPDLFEPRAAIPEGLRTHLIYPELALQVQAEILMEYHLERAEPFYAGQDVWQRPQESAPNGGMREAGPVYGLLPVPLERRVAFIGAMPFIARGRQNMTALLVVENDGDAYGDLTLYEFPRDQQIPGPGQVQAVIEQDPVISPELSLLRQRGSGVNMGRVRIVPLDSSVLYIQPLFLSAEENPIPELWRVVVSDGRNVAMDPTLRGAMAGVQLPMGEAPEAGPARRPAIEPGADWPRRALELLDRARARLRQGDWAGYGEALEALRALLERLDGGEPAGGSP